MHSSEAYAYADNEFPMYLHSEEELRIFLKDHAKGGTLFACLVGVARSTYLKRVAEQEGVSIVGMHKSVMLVDLLFVLSPNRQPVTLDENGMTIPDIGTIRSVVIACNEADEREIAIEVGNRLSSKGVNVSYVYGTEGDLP